jgi:hypothetical protein
MAGSLCWSPLSRFSLAAGLVRPRQTFARQRQCGRAAGKPRDAFAEPGISARPSQGGRYSRSRKHVSGQKLLHAHIMERQHVNGVDRENIVVNVDFAPVHHWSAPPLPSRLASRFRSNGNRSGMTSSALHRSQQRPAATGCALLPKPVYSPPQIEQYGPPQIEHV